MSLRADQLIVEPCTQRWETMPGDARRRDCGHCRRSVHDLSAMTEAAAMSFAARHPDACVRVPIDDHGRVRFVPEVPLARLRRPLRPPTPVIAVVAVAAAIGCTPHARPEAPQPTPQIVAIVHAPPTTQARAEPPYTGTFMMGAIKGPKSATPTPPDTRGVPCDTLPAHPQGKPAELDHGRTLLDAKQTASADLLALCDP